MYVSEGILLWSGSWLKVYQKFPSTLTATLKNMISTKLELTMLKNSWTTSVCGGGNGVLIISVQCRPKWIGTNRFANLPSSKFLIRKCKRCFNVKHRKPWKSIQNQSNPIELRSPLNWHVACWNAHIYIHKGDENKTCSHRQWERGKTTMHIVNVTYVVYK